MQSANERKKRKKEISNDFIRNFFQKNTRDSTTVSLSKKMSVAGEYKTFLGQRVYKAPFLKLYFPFFLSGATIYFLFAFAHTKMMDRMLFKLTARSTGQVAQHCGQCQKGNGAAKTQKRSARVHGQTSSGSATSLIRKIDYKSIQLYKYLDTSKWIDRPTIFTISKEAQHLSLTWSSLSGEDMRATSLRDTSVAICCQSKQNVPVEKSRTCLQSDLPRWSRKYRACAPSQRHAVLATVVSAVAVRIPKMNACLVLFGNTLAWLSNTIFS